MTEKFFTVSLELTAQSEKQIDKWLDQMPMAMAEAVYDTEIIDHDARVYEERIRYVEDYRGQGEHYVFEGKWSDEEDWGLDCAFQLLDYEKDGISEKGVLLNYQALTKIRELMKMKIHFYFE